MRTANLMLHCGASHVERDVLANVRTPDGTRSWQPIPHMELLNTVEQKLQGVGLRVVQEAHGLTHDGSRYFGLLQLAKTTGETNNEVAWVAGVRNSHDKRFPAGICAGGNQVFVCDNLAFSGEIKVARKHTTFILRDLPMLVGNAIGKLFGAWRHQEERIARYKTIDLADRDAHDLTIKALDAKVFCGERIAPVLKEWREPRHEEFRPRNLWSFFNAVSESWKGFNLQLLPKRSQALYEVCDKFANLN